MTHQLIIAYLRIASHSAILRAAIIGITIVSS